MISALCMEGFMMFGAIGNAILKQMDIGITEWENQLIPTALSCN